MEFPACDACCYKAALCPACEAVLASWGRFREDRVSGLAPRWVNILRVKHALLLGKSQGAPKGAARAAPAPPASRKPAPAAHRPSASGGISKKKPRDARNRVRKIAEAYGVDLSTCGSRESEVAACLKKAHPDKVRDREYTSEDKERFDFLVAEKKELAGGRGLTGGAPPTP